MIEEENQKRMLGPKMRHLRLQHSGKVLESTKSSSIRPNTRNEMTGAAPSHEKSLALQILPLYGQQYVTGLHLMGTNPNI